jgi:Mg/Co/Ni transporter MgtE
MVTLETLRDALNGLTVEQLRELRSKHYAESLADYNKKELLELVFEMWTTSRQTPLCDMTKEEIVIEIMDELDDESTEDDIEAFLDEVHKYAIEGDPTE